jgi:hypothetical protein
MITLEPRPVKPHWERKLSVLIKNGRIVTSVDDYHADIFINGSTIALIGKDLVIEADKEIDASGKLVVQPRRILLRPARARQPMAAPPASSTSPFRRAELRR